MKLLLYILLFLLIACKSQIDIDSIEQREHGLSYHKGTNKLVDGEVIGKFDNGKTATRESYKNGKAIGNWYAYGFDGEIVSHGFGIDAKVYEKKLTNINLSYSLLSINIEGSSAFATLYIDNTNLFEQPKTLVALSKEIFKDYYHKHNIDDILFYDKNHEYTISKSATLKNTFQIDTIRDKEKKTIFIR